jgi:hypothetical protein
MRLSSTFWSRGSSSRNPRKNCRSLDVLTFNSVAAPLPGKASRLLRQDPPHWRGSGRNRNAGVIVEPYASSINCGPAAGQGRGEGFTNLYPRVVYPVPSVVRGWTSLQAQDAAFRRPQSPPRAAA